MSESDPSMSDQVTTWSDTMSDQRKSVIISSVLHHMVAMYPVHDLIG